MSGNSWDPLWDLKHLAEKLAQSRCEINTCWGELYAFLPIWPVRVPILLSKLSLSWLPSMLYQESTVPWIPVFFFGMWSPSLSLWGYTSSLFLTLCSCWNWIETELNFSDVSNETVSLHIVWCIHAWTEALTCVCKYIFKINSQMTISCISSQG